MWQRAGAVILTVAFSAFSACSQSGGEGGQTARDCAAVVRFEGIVYVEGGFSTQPAKRLGRADRASCSDVGPDARGVYFADHPAQVSVWAYPGFDPAQVVGVRESGRTFRVFLAEDLPTGARREMRQSVLLDVGGAVN